MKLRTRILTFALPLTLVPFGLTALAVYFLVIRAYETEAREEQDSSLAAAIASFKKVGDGARRDIELIANLPVTADYLQQAQEDSAKQSEVRTILQLFTSQNAYCLQLSLVDAQGQERVKVSKLPGAQGLISVKGSDYFRRTLIHGRFQAPVEQVRPDRFAWVLTHHVQSSQFLGAVVLLLNTDAFQTSMRPLLASRGLNSFLFDDRGLVFTKSLSGVTEEECLKGLDLATEASRLLTSVSIESSPREVLSGSRRFLFSVYPAEAFVRSRFEPQSGENWFLGVLRPEQTAPAAASRFRMTFFAILVLAIGAVLWATTRYARRVTVPLENVAIATSQIAQGKFDVSVDVRTGDEVENLANAVNRMVEDLKRYREELLRSAKLATIGEMASEISHEIQNRIAGISLWTQYLDAELEKTDPRREYVQEIKQGLSGFNSLLSDMKQFYKTPLLQLSSVDLNDLVVASMPGVEQRIRGKQIMLDMQLDPQLPRISGDAEKLKSVILNLIVNAIEAVDEGGRVVIRTSAAKAQEASDAPIGVSLSVSDSGPGISEQDLPRVFYPFYSTKGSGSGLGLAIVSNIVSAHSGSVHVESQAGEGATFKVTIPTSDQSEV